MHRNRHQKVLVSLAAIGCFGTLAAGAIFGAFSAQTFNSGNEFSSATLNLTASNDAVAEPVYMRANAVPGDSGDTDHSCIEVTYDGTVPAEVRLFGRTDQPGDGLAAGVMLRITEGEGGVDDGCQSFTATGPTGGVFGGAAGESVQDLLDRHASFPTAFSLGTWSSGESHIYRFESWLSANVDPEAAQGKNAGNQAFVWEARAGE